MSSGLPMKRLKHCLLNFCELFHVIFKINPFRRLCIWAARLSREAEKKIKLKARGHKSRYTSPYVGGATGEQIPTSFDIFSESADIINPTEVYVDRFRGFELTRGQLKSCCSRLPVIVSKFSSDIPPPLHPLVLMLYYWNSRVIKQQVISQASKVFGAMCA
jgi:hypothetical protein